MLFSLIRSSHLDLIHHWSCVMRVHCSCLLRVCCSSPCNWFCLHFCLCFTWRAVSMDVSSLFNVYCILPCDLSMVALCTCSTHANVIPTASIITYVDSSSFIAALGGTSLWSTVSAQLPLLEDGETTSLNFGSVGDSRTLQHG